MNKVFKIAEYVGFAVLLTAFILHFNDIDTPDYFLPQMSILGGMLVAWGINGQTLK